MTGLFYSDRSEVNRRHVESRFGAPVDRCRHQAHDIIRPEAMDDVGQDGEGGASAEWAHERQWK